VRGVWVKVFLLMKTERDKEEKNKRVVVVLNRSRDNRDREVA
jgi:hypothetical protein